MTYHDRFLTPLIYSIYTSGGTKFMLLESCTKHPSRSTADHMFKSVLCARSGDCKSPLKTNLYIYIYKSLKILEGGDATGGTTSSMRLSLSQLLRYYCPNFRLGAAERGVSRQLPQTPTEQTTQVYFAPPNFSMHG